MSQGIQGQSSHRFLNGISSFARGMLETGTLEGARVQLPQHSHAPTHQAS
jgi:hypothetical protein